MTASLLASGKALCSRTGIMRKLSLWVALLVFAAVSSTAWAQTGGEGAITGTVTDTTGAYVTKASVTVTNVATNVMTSTTTSGDGLYRVEPLIPGTYTVEVMGQGFVRFLQKNLVIDAAHVTGLNVTLKVGSKAEEVTVTDAPPALETTNATLGGTIENSTYAALPLLLSGNQQRDITQFSNLLPGAQLNPGGRSSIIGGTEQRLGELYLDGLPLTTISQQGDNRPVFNAVPMEAIEQIQVITSGYPAEFQGAGLENYTLKSGTNQLHGTVADYIRNTIFDTWGFSAPYATITNAAGAKGFQKDVGTKPVDHQNELTFSIGGPVVIPHFINGHDKLFFHATYDRAHTRSAPTYAATTIPTVAMRTGDFSGLLTANGGPGIAIYDPTTQASCTAHSTTGTCRYQYGFGPAATNGAAGNPVATGAPINVIPVAEQSPIALKQQSFLPAPSNTALTNNYIGGIPGGFNNYLWAARVDYNLTQNQRLSFAFSNGRRTAVPFTSGTSVLPVPYLNSTLSSVVGTFGDIEYAYTISPHIVNQLLLGYMYFGGPPVRNITEGVSQYAATTLGITGLPPGQAANEFPNVAFGSGTDAPTSWGGAGTTKTVSHTYDIVDNLTWTKGQHSFTFGIQLQDLMENISAANSTSTPLTLTYAANETAAVSGTSYTSNTGFAYSSFLLGAVNANGASSAAVQALSDVGQRFHPIAPYAQDDWKITPKLTLNLGLRWDYMPGYREVLDRFSYLDPNATNPYTGNKGGLMFAGTYGGSTASCNCDTPVQTYWKNFGPRVGFAYAPHSTMTIRGSFGILYTHGGPTGGANSTPGTTGFTTPNTYTANGAGPAAGPVFYLNNSTYFTTNGIANTAFGGAATPAITVPLPPTQASQALGVGNYVNGAGAFVSAGAAPGYADPYHGDRTPTFYFFNLGFQQAMTKDITLTVNYAGSVSHFLSGNAGLRGLQSGQVDPKYLALGTLLTKPATAANITAAQAILPGCCTTPYAGFAAAAATTAGSGQATIAQGLKWMPQYSSTADPWGAYTANAAYNALQVSVGIRPTHGVTFNFNYTWSKEMDDAGTIRSGYPIPASAIATGKAWAADRIDRSLSTINVPQNIAAYGVYDLPFGKGHIGGNHLLVRILAQGWELSGILQISSGYPLTLSSSSCTTSTLPNQGTCMPDINPNFTGPIMSAPWGQGATALNLGTKTYVNAGPTGFLSNSTPGNGVNSAGASVPCAQSTGPFCNPAAFTIGDAARTGAFGLRSPYYFRLASGLRRTIDLTERFKFVLGVDCQNLTNSVTFGNNVGNLQIPTGVNSSNFGTLTFASADSRDFQFSGRINF